VRSNIRLPPYADRFTPELWLDGQAEQQRDALVPFSEGAAVCPGRQLVLLLTTAMLTDKAARYPHFEPLQASIRPDLEWQLTASPST
jgi:cytochrome P450